MTEVKYPTREQWLQAAIEQFEPWFEQEEHKLPEVMVSVGVQPSERTLATCWDPGAANGEVSEKVAHIFVTPSLQPEEPTRLLDVLLHELVHAAGHVAGFTGHGKEFGALARALGLTGKMTATVASEELVERLVPIAEHLGPYPHTVLNPSALGLGPSGKPKQKARQLKSICAECGYTARVSRKWLDIATPLCPNPACGNFEHPMEGA
jgi:hypothetical protein